MSADPDQFEMIRAQYPDKKWYELTDAELDELVDTYDALGDVEQMAVYELLGMTREEWELWCEDPAAARRAAKEAE